MKPWNMFIDDERNPADAIWAAWHKDYINGFVNFVVVRTKMQAIQAIFDHGKVAPNFVSFDHDLGDGESTGYDIARWMVDADMDKIISIPAGFEFYVHSQNPVGKKNIEAYLSNYLKITGV
jgi:hypothetical protein